MHTEIETAEWLLKHFDQFKKDFYRNLDLGEIYDEEAVKDALMNELRYELAYETAIYPIDTIYEVVDEPFMNSLLGSEWWCEEAD